jgi:DNA invertase Pin-like site-specific DNA recombinase
MNTCPFPPHAPIAAYLRDSGGEEQDLSTAQQEAAIRAWCTANHLILTELYIDRASPGSTTVGRTQFQAMIHYFRTPNIPEKGIVLWKFNRLARDFDQAAFYKADLRRRGYILHSLQDNIPEGPEGRLIEAVIDFMSDRFLDDLSIDVKRGLHHLVTAYGALPGLPPRGFFRQPIQLPNRRDGSPHIGHRWVPDPDLWQTCRLAWTMRRAGASYAQINKETHLYTSLNSYKTFYSNRLYIGELVYGDLVIPDYAPPLIDQPTWDAVQILNHRPVHPAAHDPECHPRRIHSAYLLSGLAVCARCGAPLSGGSSPGRPRKNGQPAAAWRYYRCSAATRKRSCDAPKIPANALERTILDEVNHYILSPKALAAAELLLQQDRQVQRQANIARRKELTQQLAVVNQGITHLTAAIRAAGHSRALISDLIAQETLRTTLELQIKNLDLQLTPHPILSENDLARFADNLRHAIATGTLATVRTIIRAFTRRLTIDRHENIALIYIEYYHPPTAPPPPNLIPPNDNSPTDPLEDDDPTQSPDPNRTVSTATFPLGALPYKQPFP